VHGYRDGSPTPLHALLTIREIPDYFQKGRDQMNIFEHRSSFFGSLTGEVTDDSLLSLFKMAKQIRQRMGKQGYLLDCYLSLLFEGVSNALAYDAADEGFQSGGKLQNLCFHVLDGTEPEKEHPLYGRAKEVFAEQKVLLPYQERYTRLCLLMFPLADEMMAYATAMFLEDRENALNGVVDEIRLQELYKQISHLAGESMMEELNRRLRQRFLIATQVAVFAQGLTDDLLNGLTYRDQETGRQMFQLLLDNLPDTSQ
jgi:hypothetical protein